MVISTPDIDTSHKFPHLILWNARSLLPKLNEFRNYLYNLEPLIVCITETHLKQQYSPKFQNYYVFRKDRDDGFGGLLILCHKSISAKLKDLIPYQNGVMEYLSIEYSFQGKWSTLILLYNPCKNLSENEINHYLCEVDTTGIVCGDLNAHHETWELNGPKPNPSGKSLFNVLTRSVNLRLLNPVDLPTRTDPSSGKTSNIDLLITTSDYNNLNISIGKDLGSDHQPVILSPQGKAVPLLYFRSRWTIKEGLWSDWRNSLKEVPTPSDTNDPLDSEYNLFKEAILGSSHEFFSISDSSKPRRPGQPWWNKDCEVAVEARRRALKKFQKSPSPQNKRLYNQANKYAKQTTKLSKEQAWSTFLSTINPRTPISIVWKFFRAMKGGTVPSSIPLSDQDNNPADSEKSAEIMAAHYQTNFSYSLPLSSEDSDKLETALLESPNIGINSPITFQELDKSIRHTPSKSSPGVDLIHNQFLINLPATHRSWLLSLFNKSFETGSIPSDWKESHIIPILKPGKDSSAPNSYRPISLLSCVGKVMERVISWRIQWHLETGSHLLPEQFGFRPCRSTADPLSILEHTIQKGYRTQRVTLVVFLDLSAAFDRASPKAVLLKLAGMGLEGNILRWLHNYLSDRKFSVSIRNKSSEQRQILSSVPQGSALSPTLFNILLSDLPQSRNVKSLVYADDITLYVTATDLNEARSDMQEALDKFMV